MSEHITEVTTGNFDEEVKNHKGGTVLVDFWAEWCGPCRMINPILEEIAQELPDVKVCKVNTDESPTLSRTYQIRSIPTMLYFKDGEMYDQTVGALPKEQFLERIKK